MNKMLISSLLVGVLLSSGLAFAEIVAPDSSLENFNKRLELVKARKAEEEAAKQKAAAEAARAEASRRKAEAAAAEADAAHQKAEAARMKAKLEEMERKLAAPPRPAAAEPKPVPQVSPVVNYLTSPGEWLSVFRDAFKDGRGTGPGLVVIPASREPFTMGTSDSSIDERPPHPVTIRQAFAIGKFEVTVKEYLACVQANGCDEPEWREAASPYHYQTGTGDLYKKIGSDLSGDTNPIVGVSWFNAIQYVNWLSIKTGQRYRLPSEAEWEYACRAGGTSTYCGGEALDQLGWFGSNSESKTHPVGLKKPNAFGLNDMSGNVWEWVEDCYVGDYKNGPWNEMSRGDLNDKQCSRVLRGGSWSGGSVVSRAGIREYFTPTDRNVSGGFRVARTLP